MTTLLSVVKMKRRLNAPYELQFERRKGYVYARISAPSIDRSTALDYLSEIADECANVKCKRLMIERDIPSMMSDGELYNTMDDFVRLSSGLRIAFVNPHRSLNDAMRKIIRYGAGKGADIEYFDSVDEAEKWLTSNGLDTEKKPGRAIPR